MKDQSDKQNIAIRGDLTKKAVLLTLLYLVLWAVGPLLFGGMSSTMLAGLPLWFWFSCVLAPVLLVALTYFVFLRG